MAYIKKENLFSIDSTAYRAWAVSAPSVGGVLTIEMLQKAVDALYRASPISREDWNLAHRVIMVKKI